ncbi:MAG: FecR domain-containing protein [Flavobacteriaceae bacterium]|nr:FecR domain-containing protein [Flavobacteriaceae bacterium]
MENKEKIYLNYLNGQNLDDRDLIILEKWFNTPGSEKEIQLKNQKIKDLVITNHLANLSLSSYDSSEAFNSFDKKTKERKIRKIAFRNNLNSILKYAAIFITVLGISFFVSKQSNSQKLLSVYVPKGENRQVVLPDGTIVLLNSNSTLKYPSPFSKNNRKVELTGEAYFDVAKIKTKPFIINLPSNMNIKVLGTSFNVKAYPEDSKNITTLFTGKIELTYKNKKIIKNVMLPGTKADFTKTTNTMSISKTNLYNDVLAWKKKMLVFKNESLKDIVNELNRFYDVDININNKKLEDLIFTASFKKGININEVINFFEKSGNIKFKQKSNKKWELILPNNSNANE